MNRWLQDLEEWFARKVQGAARQVTAAPREKTLLEICKDVQEDLRARIIVQDRGIRAFPYTRIELSIYTKDEDQRSAYEAVLSSDPPFGQRMREMLIEEGCRLRELEFDLAVRSDSHLSMEPKPFTLRCHRGAAKAPTTAGRPRATLTVLKGSAESSEVELQPHRTNLGRMREVAAKNGAVIRINHLAFLEVETSVAREHAYILWNADALRYLLFDHISGSRGTRIFRLGESITLPKGSGKGTALLDGDEIHLGTARVQFCVERSAI